MMKYLLTVLLAVSIQVSAKTHQAGELTLTLPKKWKVETPKSSMRTAQFKVKGSKGDAECVVFFFGKDRGGSIDENIERWIGQFNDDGERKSSVSKGKSREGNYHLLNAHGTFNNSMGGPFSGNTVAQKNTGMLAAIVEHKSGNYFIKFTGPKKTIEENKNNFMATFGAK